MKIFSKILNRKKIDHAQNTLKNHASKDKFSDFLLSYIQSILIAEPVLEKEIDKIIAEYKQKIDKNMLIKDLFVIRYLFIHIWFLELMRSEKQNNLDDNIKLINQVFEKALKTKGKTEYISWLAKALAKYNCDIKSIFDDQNKLNALIAEKLPQIAFECTGGRLAGELYNSVIELVMTTIQEDKNLFEFKDDTQLTTGQKDDIHKAIDEMGFSDEEISDCLIDSVIQMSQEQGTKQYNFTINEDCTLDEQRNSLVEWACNEEMEPEYRRNVMNEISRMKKVLKGEDLSRFIRRLVELKLGIGVTFEETKRILELTKKVDEAEARMKNGGDKKEYDMAVVNLQNFMDYLKKET
jgi:hypothetical protein